MVTDTRIAVAQNGDFPFKNIFLLYIRLYGYFLAVACLTPNSLVGT